MCAEGSMDEHNVDTLEEILDGGFQVGGKYIKIVLGV